MRKSATARVRVHAAVTVLAALLLAACERIVEVELPASEPRLVVQGRIERVKEAVSGRQRIQLTTTSDYFRAAVAPPAIGASVRVVDDNGTTTVFAQTSPGVFETSALTGVIGRRYRLEIDYGGDRYEAVDTLHAVAPIRTLYFDRRAGVLGPKEGFRATIAFTEPEGDRNYYTWDQYIDGTRIIAPDSSFRTRVVANDDLIDGQDITGFQPYEGIVVPSGSMVLVRQIALSAAAYRYYFALGDQTLNDGSPFSVPPSNVRGNVSNRTRPSRYPLGYFMAGEVSERRLRLQ